MKASFPPFASCFPPWSGFASPRRLHQRATGAWLGALVVHICLRVLDRTAKQHENRTTIKAFSQTEEGDERTARRMRGERNNLHLLENAAMHLRFISSRSKMDMRTRAGRKRRTRCLDQARPRAAVPPLCGFTNSDMLVCEKRQLAGHNLHNYTRRRPSIFSHHTAAFPSRGAR